MQGVKKVINTLRNILEIVIPGGCFIIMLILFLVNIFCRYILHNSIRWSNEVISITFLWTVLFGSLYSSRTKAHVRFTLLTDKLPPRADCFMGLLGNLIIIILFIAAIKPTLDFLAFIRIKKSSVLHIGMHIIDAPFMLMLLGAIVYQLIEAYDNLMMALGKKEVPPRGAEEYAAAEAAQAKEEK